MAEWLKRAFWEERWCVGLIEEAAFWRSAENGVLADRDVQWLRSSNDYFLADPCWISESERLFTAECFHYRRRIGSLLLVKESDGKAVPMGTIKVNNVHHSYPMVYPHGDAFLVIPESAGCNSVNAISIDRSGKVIDETPILSGMRLVDPTVFSHGGAYWMFANPLDNFDDELVVFRGESVVGPWYATALGPLSIPNCRGAGRIFAKDGILYWPTQYNSDRYGGGVVLRRIISLTETELEHDVAAVIMPDPKGSRPLGFHTVSNGENHYLVDGLAHAFSPIKPLYVLMSRFQRRLRRPAHSGSDASASAEQG